MMDEPVDCSDGHSGIGKHVVPAREGLVGRDEKATALVPFGDQFEQHARFSLVLAGVRQVVQDDQVESIEFGKGRTRIGA